MRNSRLVLSVFSGMALSLFSASPGVTADLPTNAEVTQDNITSTICVRGWTKTVRPPVSYTRGVKIQLLREFEIPIEQITDYELDHRIPLCLGGSPDDRRNLELEPWNEASQKDAIEVCLCRAVCAGSISLKEAQARIWADWRNSCTAF